MGRAGGRGEGERERGREGTELQVRCTRSRHARNDIAHSRMSFGLFTNRVCRSTHDHSAARHPSNAQVGRLRRYRKIMFQVVEQRHLLAVLLVAPGTRSAFVTAGAVCIVRMCACDNAGFHRPWLLRLQALSGRG